VKARRRVQLAADLLAVDVGNSKTLVVLLRGGKERGRWRLDYGGMSRARLLVCARAAARAARDRGAAGAPCVVASVAPARARLVLGALRGAGLRVHTAHWRDPWPFEIDVDAPERVGVDRLANVAGLVALGIQTGLAIDAGTAITLDVLHRGRFVGGLILPGFELAARALHEHTSLLPYVEASGPVPLVGRDTRGALRAGVHHGTLQAIAGLARRLCAELGPGARCVTTGGQGQLAARACPPGTAVFEPDLLTLGLQVVTRSKTR
jgi:type III pantothenate kinase